jgi:hypothetical protein
MPRISENSSFKSSSFISKPRTSTRSHYEIGNEYLTQLRNKIESQQQARDEKK